MGAFDLVEFAGWLQTQPLSLSVRRAFWIIPLLQTIHLLAVGMVLSSLIMIDLRIWGIGRSHTLVQSTHRFAPWIWVAMALLTVTGIVLVLSQPRRTLLDPTFQAKMLLMTAAIVLTIPFQLAATKAKAWDSAGAARVIAGVFAAALLILWIVVTFAGRSRWVMGFLR
jgi:hypothetical protein